MINEKLQSIIKSLPLFAETFLKIRSKSGKVIPFKFWRGQSFLHERLENQLKETGKVRAILVKGRQGGYSTYTQARYFHKVTTQKGNKAFILAHQAEATKNIFNITKNYYDLLPKGLIPTADTSSSKELNFKSLSSGYAVATAGSRGAGRSQTIQLFHGCLGCNTLIYDPILQIGRSMKSFNIGDFVLTHNGNIAPISYISTQDKACLNVSLITLERYPLIATKEHKFYTKSGWQKLENLKVNDEIGFPVKKNVMDCSTRHTDQTIEISNGYAWLKIKAISNYGITEVCDFEVNHQDHSYCTIHAATHNSEVAYWPNAEEHAQGVLQAVSNQPGTEIVLESTANGMGNYFHNMWLSAISGGSEFQAIFIPWFWQEEYTATTLAFETTTLSDEEQILLDLHKDNGLTIPHLYWRRRKLKEFSNDHETAVERFSVEYPMTSLDAFRNSVEDRLIKSNLVLQARKNKVESSSPLVLGCDPAVSDTDRFAIIRRRGRLAYNIETHYNMKSTEIIYHIVNIINRENPQKVCIDSIGIGAPICDRLIELGYGNIIEPVNVARKSNDRDRYLNLRAELWDKMKEWLAQEMPVQIPDSDELMTDLTAVGYHYRNAGGKLQIEAKEELKSRGMKSPDIADALALTFYVGEYLNQNNYLVNRLPEKSAGMFV